MKPPREVMLVVLLEYLLVICNEMREHPQHNRLGECIRLFLFIHLNQHAARHVVHIEIKHQILDNGQAALSRHIADDAEGQQVNFLLL